MKNVQYSTLFRPQELHSREYHLNTYQGNFLPLESVSLIQKHKSCKNVFPWTCRSISSEFVHQTSWEKQRVGEDHIFVNEQSFKFRY